MRQSYRIETNPKAAWIFIVDQLNIHKLASRVRLVAACCELDIGLGVKGEEGILESKQTRAAFFSDCAKRTSKADRTHRIRFVYIPKHTSWLNQVECWFSISQASLTLFAATLLPPMTSSSKSSTSSLTSIAPWQSHSYGSLKAILKSLRLVCYFCHLY